MSTADLLEQVKELRAEERAKFLAAVGKLAAPKSDESLDEDQVEWPDIEERARRNTGGKMVPNMVLWEREAQEAEELARLNGSLR